MSMVVDRPHRRIRRDEYDRMVEAGLFQRERLELIRGELLTMSPIGLSHSIVVKQLYRLLVRAVPRELEVCSQQPLICVDESEPEPDVSVVPFDPNPVMHPTRALLVIEVAETSVAYDLGDKADLYAESDVVEYWVIDLPARMVHVHRDRVEGRWTSIVRYPDSQRLTSIAVPGVSVALVDLLTPRA